MTSAGSVPRPASRRTSSSQDGGARKTSWASGIARAHLPGALQVDLQQHRAPGGEVVEHRLPRRAVEVAGELGPLEQAARGDQLLRTARAVTNR